MVSDSQEQHAIAPEDLLAIVPTLYMGEKLTYKSVVYALYRPTFPFPSAEAGPSMTAEERGAEKRAAKRPRAASAKRLFEDLSAEDRGALLRVRALSSEMKVPQFVKLLAEAFDCA
jgi:hypothetical protein